MADIITLSTYKARCALQGVRRYWNTLFDEPFDAEIRLSDLYPITLCYLAESGDQSTNTLYDLIIGLGGFRETTTFDSLDSAAQNKILDIHMFISDQIRFEMMSRLGWLESVPGNRVPLFEMVTSFERVNNLCWVQPPSLAIDHADYDIYAELFELDQQVFIRRMATSALEAFKKTYGLT